MCRKNNVKFFPQLITDVILIQPTVHGNFIGTFKQGLFDKVVGYTVNFFQDSESKSAKDVLCGLYYQLPSDSQNKLSETFSIKIPYWEMSLKTYITAVALKKK